MVTEKERDWVNRMHRMGVSGPGWTRQDVRNILLFCDGIRYRAERFIFDQCDGRIPVNTLTFILWSRILALEERIEILENPLEAMLDL